MIYRLLGELEVRQDGVPLNLPGGPTLILLAALLINANRRMSKADLIRAAWGDEHVREAQLYKRINALRDVLEQIGRDGDLRTHARFGYEMRVSEEDVDALLFRRLIRAADEAAAAGDTEAESGYLRQALRLWRGPHPLSDVPSEALRRDTVALEQRHKRAAARLFGIELARGNHERILDELLLVAGYYPADPRLCEQLMTAQYRCGHVTDVASAYERYREALSEETGAEPDRLLRAMHFAIARGDAAGIAEAEAAIARRGGTAATSPPGATVPRQLPRPAELVGRDAIAAEASRILSRWPRPAPPVVVISGPAGVGKTALALLAARASSGRYPHGQLYAELRGSVGGTPDTGEILAQFLRAFGVPRIPESTAERLAEYRTLLAQRRVLVVLDDAADGAQVSDLVPPSPASAVLVTARRRLPEISGAHHLPALAPLNQADATELFLRVVRDGGIELGDDLDAVQKVVALCGGLPLAVRMAGSLRVRDHPRSTAELANRLATLGPEALGYGELDVARTIGAGFERLSPEARELFLRLGLLPLPGFGLWTATALVGGADVNGARALSQLTASSMIDAVPVESSLSYRFHDLTREYARRRALATGELTEAPARAYVALLTLVRHAHTCLYGGDFEVVHSDVADWDAPPELLAEVDAAPLAWFERERLNIRLAVEQCATLGLTGLCWDLAVSAHEFYNITGHFDDWHATHVLALDACRKAGDKRGEGIVLACLNQPALVASRRVRSATRLAELERAASLLAECGDRHGQAIALRSLANALRRQGHLTRPLKLFNEAFAYYAASADVVGQWQTLRFIGQTQLDLGSYEAARRVLETVEAMAAERGGGRLLAQTRYWIGQACLAAGDVEAAQAAFDAVFDVYTDDDEGIGKAYALHGLGDLARCRGAWAVAGRHLTAAAELALEGGDAVLEGRVWLSLAALRHAEGFPDQEAAALERAVTVFADCGAVNLEMRALAAVAKSGAEPVAAQAWARIDSLYRAAGVPDRDCIYRRQ